MSTTTPVQSAGPDISADDIQVLRTPPTIADAQLVLQQALVDATTGANRGFGVLRRFDSPPTLAQLRKKHAPGSTEHDNAMAFLVSCETTGTFVRQGILNEALVDDLYWIEGAWRAAEKVCKGMRREAGEPRLFENFEWLAKRQVSS
jgi:hypothetical protein